jgi:hypothetical protein
VRRSLTRPAQALYAALNTAAGRVPLGQALPELYTDGFDAEQVWRQARPALAPPLGSARVPPAGTTLF